MKNLILPAIQRADEQDERFYTVRRSGYVALYDTRNRLAGCMAFDTVKEARCFAAVLVGGR